MSAVRILVLLVLTGAAALAQAATRHAVLVGVSEYDRLPPYLHLRGPKNDVALMREVLAARGFEPARIALLADGLAGAQRPTRDNILAALDALEPARGDVVFLYFAGHGSQQPAADTAGAAHEPDGLDEIFLPADIGRWDRQIGAVENAIRDDEIGARIVSLRNRGAFVWAVFDSCHSGTMTRALPLPDERERNVDAQDALGVPASGRPAPPARDDDWFDGRAGADLAADAGGFAGFYASQSGETTPEMRLPADRADAPHHGLFTYHLARALASAATVSYRHAGQRILQDYAAWQRLRPTPLYEGTDLDAPLFAARAAGGPPHWPVRVRDEGLQIDAGRLHDVVDDAVVALVASPADGDAAVLGYARVTDSALARAQLRPVRHAGVAKPRLDRLPATVFARLVETPVSVAVRVAAPPRAPGAEYAAYEQIARRAAARSSEIAWVAASAPADVRLALRDGHLWLLPPSGEWRLRDDAGIGVALDGDPDAAAAELAAVLARMGRVIRLTRLNQFATGTAVDFELTLGVREAGGALRALPADAVPALDHGQRLALQLANRGARPVDVTVLHVDSRYGLSVVYPLDVGNRIEPQGTDWVEAQIDATETTGLEQLLVIAVAAEPNAAPADFGFLAQPRLDDATERRAGNGFAELVRNVAAGEGRRGWSFGRARARDLERSLVLLRAWTVRAGRAPKLPNEEARDET